MGKTHRNKTGPARPRNPYGGNKKARKSRQKIIDYYRNSDDDFIDIEEEKLEIPPK